MTDYQSYYSITEYINGAVQKRNDTLDETNMYEDVTFTVDMDGYDVNRDEVNVGPSAQFMRLALIHKAILEKDITLTSNDTMVLTP